MMKPHGSGSDSAPPRGPLGGVPGNVPYSGGPARPLQRRRDVAARPSPWLRTESKQVVEGGLEMDESGLEDAAVKDLRGRQRDGGTDESALESLD
ncbi:hypothetical protein ACP70R_018059 [Stipagrostis hirtigluma subsp. patula]